MTRDEFDNLKVGDWVREIDGGRRLFVKDKRLEHGYVSVALSDSNPSWLERYTNLELVNSVPTPPPSDHYKRLGLEPWDAMRHWLTPEEYRGYQKGTALAYIARERLKGGDNDIGKAIAHLQKLLDTIEQQDQPEGTL